MTKTITTNKNKNKKSKWRRLSDLMYAVEKESPLAETPIRVITRASNVGERMWVVKYEEIYAVLFDLGNGHWEYFTHLSILSVIYSVIFEHVDFFLFKLKNSRKKKESSL